jgi:hypothetical protein
LILKDAIEHTKLLNGYQYQEGDGGVISEDIEHRVKNFEFAPSPAALVGRASVPAKSNFCGSGFPAATS